jgi:hypothetical protein
LKILSQVRGFEFKKEENKLKMSIAMFIVFLLTTLILYIFGRLNWSSIYIAFIALGIPIGCATFVDNMLEKSKEKQVNNEDSWSTNPDELVKTKKTRFSKFKGTERKDISKFAVILSIVVSYVSVYISEVFIWTKTVLENYPDTTFSYVFTDLLKNILTEEWSRKYLVMYWIFMTGFIIFIAIGYFWNKRKMAKMQKKDEEQNNNIRKS